MTKHSYFKSKIFNIQSEGDFSALALEMFQWQAEANEVYRSYLNHLGTRPREIKSIEGIPFMPVGFFKDFEVKTGTFEAEAVYTSSGTSGTNTSRHFVKEDSLYEDTFLKAFSLPYGEAGQYCTLALLPSYLERRGSSLIRMADTFIRRSVYNQSGFYLDDLQGLQEVLQYNVKHNIPTLLLGVTFALLDLAESFPAELDEKVIVMETGGMKGRRKEMIRAEVHEILKAAFKVDRIHSEYGMTELMSQAYSKGEGRFFTPPWMKVFVRDIADPFTFSNPGKTGGINIIDLANISSCAFIETEDLGRCYSDGSFEVMGRFDHSDIRGCNLMVV